MWTRSYDRQYWHCRREIRMQQRWLSSFTVSCRCWSSISRNWRKRVFETTLWSSTNSWMRWWTLDIHRRQRARFCKSPLLLFWVWGCLWRQLLCTDTLHKSPTNWRYRRVHRWQWRMLFRGEQRVSDTAKTKSSSMSLKASTCSYAFNSLLSNYPCHDVFLQVNAEGTVVRSEILGAIKMKCYLSGMPELRLGLNDKVMFESTGRTSRGKAIEMEDVKFHQCVRLSRFENDRTISFIPPDGEFELMSYRLSTPVKPLIWVEAQVESHKGSRVEYMVKVKAQFKRRSTANNVEIYVPVPDDADSPKFRVNFSSYWFGELVLNIYMRRLRRALCSMHLTSRHLYGRLSSWVALVNSLCARILACRASGRVCSFSPLTHSNLRRHRIQKLTWKNDLQSLSDLRFHTSLCQVFRSDTSKSWRKVDIRLCPGCGILHRMVMITGTV